MKRTAPVALDGTFEYICDVTKMAVLPDGRRVIRGVASGLLEDRSGERVSKNAIRDMALQPVEGMKFTASHDQDWLTEIGDVAKLAHDPATDELVYECILPPEGEDPIADKAWRAAQREKLGVSIGGKLRKGFYELVEGANGVRKRKVLDKIELRHLALTKKPCYPGTFAEAVAKTFTGDEPADDLFIEKAADDDEPPAAAAAQAAPDASAADNDPGGQPDPQQQQQQQQQAPSDAQDTAQLPEAKRHLACPNCGEEFAAPMPIDAPNREQDQGDHDEDDQAKAEKSHPKENPMDPMKDAVAKLRDLAGDGDADVAKEAAPVEEEAVEKAEDDLELGDVVKMVAASHAHNETAVADLRENTTKGFDLVVKAITDLRDSIGALPKGRKSVARVLPPASEVQKTDEETDDVAKAVAEAGDAVSALKAMNRIERGIR